MNVAETARKALEILDRDGWCKFAVTWTSFQKQMYPGHHYPEGSHCLSGLWGEAVGIENAGNRELYEPLAAVVREQYPEYIPGIDPNWPLTIIPAMNDALGITEADVRAILEKVIANGS